MLRSLHLYTGLFLSPWMLVYATSAFCLNHDAWVRELFHVVPPSWELVREVSFVPAESFPVAPDDQASAILQKLGLDGPHHIQVVPATQPLTIIRQSGGGNYRITWHRERSVVAIERQQPFSALRLLHFLHFRGGYRQAYAAVILWAIIVDAVAISLWLWVISGVYLWMRRPNKRKLGTVCVVMGCALFVALVTWLCV